jgi:N-acetyl-anhydromuramyl-L-alanine amidase AmpD
LLSVFAVSTSATGLDGDADRRLDEIRRRLRAEAGAWESAPNDADLPMVPLTILGGDTHARLALELTGTRDAEIVLRRIEPRLRPGRRLYVPRALLPPRLADPRLESLPLEAPYHTLWSLTKRATLTRGLGTAATVRNLQRLNGISDPTKLHKGAKILVPRSLLVLSREVVSPPLRINSEFRVADWQGLERQARASQFPPFLIQELQKKRSWKPQLRPRGVGLVVIHTTEHRGAPFENVGRFLQRKRLTNYLVGPDGAVYAVVPEAYRAFGCGQSLWEGRYAVDHEAINIEIFADTAPGKHRTGISEVQYLGLRRLLADIQSRRPNLHDGRVLTHRMVALNYRLGNRSRKGDPYEFDWSRAGLPDNSRAIDQDVLLGRAKLCTDERYTDRVTPGQTAAARLQHNL